MSAEAYRKVRRTSEEGRNAELAEKHRPSQQKKDAPVRRENATRQWR